MADRQSNLFSSILHKAQWKYSSLQQPGTKAKKELNANKSTRKKGESKGGKKGNKHVKGKRKLQKQQI